MQRVLNHDVLCAQSATGQDAAVPPSRGRTSNRGERRSCADYAVFPNRTYVTIEHLFLNNGTCREIAVTRTVGASEPCNRASRRTGPDPLNRRAPHPVTESVSLPAVNKSPLGRGARTTVTLRKETEASDGLREAAPPSAKHAQIYVDAPCNMPCDRWQFSTIRDARYQ
jgi:hypothetical protein